MSDKRLLKESDVMLLHSIVTHDLLGPTVLDDAVQRMQSQLRHQAISCTDSML